MRLLTSLALAACLAAPALAQEDELPPLPTRAEVLAEIEAALDQSLADWQGGGSEEDPAFEYQRLAEILAYGGSEMPFENWVGRWLQASEVLIESMTADGETNSHIRFIDQANAFQVIAPTIAETRFEDAFRAQLEELLAALVSYDSDPQDQEVRWTRSETLWYLAEAYRGLGDMPEARRLHHRSREFIAPHESNGCRPYYEYADLIRIGAWHDARREITAFVECRFEHEDVSWNDLRSVLVSIAPFERESALQTLDIIAPLAPGPDAAAQAYREMANVYDRDNQAALARISAERSAAILLADPATFSDVAHGITANLLAQVGRCDLARQIGGYARQRAAVRALEERLREVEENDDRVIVTSALATNSVVGQMLRADLACQGPFLAIDNYLSFTSDFGAAFATHGMAEEDPALMLFEVFRLLENAERDSFLDALNRPSIEPRWTRLEPREHSIFDGRPQLILMALAAHRPFSPIDREAAVRALYQSAYTADDAFRGLEALAWLAVALPE